MTRTRYSHNAKPAIKTEMGSTDNMSTNVKPIEQLSPTKTFPNFEFNMYAYRNFTAVIELLKAALSLRYCAKSFIAKPSPNSLYPKPEDFLYIKHITFLI